MAEPYESQPHPPSYASYATSFPIISLADNMQLNSSSRSPPVTSSDDYLRNFLNDRVITNKHFQPSFSVYSGTSDYFTIQSSPPPLFPSSNKHELASSDQSFAASHKRSHHQHSVFDDMPFNKRLIVELSASSHLQHKKAGEHQSVPLRAQYPPLSRELADEFFASNLNVSSGVMGGLDDSELGLAINTASRQANETSGNEKAQQVTEQAQTGPQAVLPRVGVTPQLRILSPEPQTSQQPQVSTSSSTMPSVPFELSSLSSVQSTFSSSDSFPSDNSFSLSNLINRLLPPDTEGEGKQRMRRRLTDKQRRAKIKSGLENLRSLIALYGNASSDQASIVSSSVGLIQQLVNEREDLKHQLRKVSDERVELEREQLAIDKQRLAAVVLPVSLPSATAAAEDKQSPRDLSVLLHHLSNILTPILGFGWSDSESNINDGGVAGGLEHLVLSQYFLHTLKLLTNRPRSNRARLV